MSEITEFLGKALDAKVTERVYDDIASPGFKELGKIGADAAKTARLFLAPLQIAALFQERFERFLRKADSRIPEDRRIEVRAEIVGPAVESMRYLEEGSSLWKMFEELLLKSADRDSVSLVHPSFVHIVKQLTPDEANMLFKLRQGEFKIVDRMELNRALNRFENRVVESSTIPNEELLNPEAVSIYYAHLESLSLVSWPVTKQTPIVDAGVQTGTRRDSNIQLTEFGILFVTACLPPGGASTK